MIKVKLAIVLLCGMVVLAACEKEGPIGPQGEPGVTGAKGDAGPKGEKGDPGTANVMYSDWKNVTFTNSVTYWKCNLAAPEVTQAVLDKGNVLVYMRYKFQSIVLYYQLNYYNGTSWVFKVCKVGNIDLRASYNAGALNDFRYVIIPGGVAAKARTAGLDFNNFPEVAKAFGLPN